MSLCLCLRAFSHFLQSQYGCGDWLLNFATEGCCDGMPYNLNTQSCCYLNGSYSVSDDIHACSCEAASCL